MNCVYIAHVISESIKSKVIWELPSTMKVLMSGYSWDHLFKLGWSVSLTIQYKLISIDS